MLIIVDLSDELRYNAFNTHYKDIYRVNFIKDGDGEFRKDANTPAPGGPAIAQDIAGVAAVGSRDGVAMLGREGGMKGDVEVALVPQ